MSEPIKRDYIFYKFIHNCKEIGDFCYVGSTSNETKRKQKHKNDCNNPDSKKYNYDVYKIMRANGGFSNFKMVTIGTATQISKREANKIEEQYRVSESANMNTRRAFITPEQKIEYDKQYRVNNADKLKESRKEHYAKNKQTIIKKVQQYIEKNKQAIIDYRKEYRNKNRDAILAKKREYYAKHKEDIQLKAKEYNAKHKEDIQLKAKEYNAKHKQAIIDYKKKYRSANKDKINQYQKEYRAKKNQSTNQPTTEEI